MLQTDAHTSRPQVQPVSHTPWLKTSTIVNSYTAQSVPMVPTPSPRRDYE